MNGGDMDLDALIAEQKQAIESVEPVEQNVLLGDTLVTVLLYPMAGHEWRSLKAVHPPRPGSALDDRIGCNIDAVVRAYPRVAIRDGDSTADVSKVISPAGAPARRKWDDILDVVSAPNLEFLALAAWGLNQEDPEQRILTAGKALAGSLRRKRN